MSFHKNVLDRGYGYGAPGFELIRPISTKLLFSPLENQVKHNSHANKGTLPEPSGGVPYLP